MKLTRDSALLYLGLAAALITYLTNASSPPNHWTYNEWLQFAAAVVAAIIARLQTSPLPSKAHVRATTPLARVVPLLLLTVFIVGCHPPSSIVTPQGKAAYNADQVVVRIGRLQDAAIAAEAQHAIPTDLTRQIVTFTVAANKALKETPNGWYPAVKVAWDNLNSQIPQSIRENPSILAAWTAVETIIAVLAPGGGQIDESRIAGRDTATIGGSGSGRVLPFVLRKEQTDADRPGSHRRAEPGRR